jgi:hypothetical protein
MKKLSLIFSLIVLCSLGMLGQSAFNIYPNTFTATNLRTCLKADASGNKWMGTTGSVTSSKGAYKFDGVSWSVYNTGNSGIASNIVNDIAFDAGNTWFATRAGVSKFDGTTWTTYNISNSGLPHDTVQCIASDGTGMWIGTRNGLANFNGSSWTIYNTINSGIINNYVTAIGINSTGEVWIGTPSGFSIRQAGGSWVSYNEYTSNFIGGQVNAFYFDGASVWLGTSNGVVKFENGEFLPLVSTSIGMDMNVPQNVKSLSKGPQGGVLVGGTKGFPVEHGFYEIVGAQIYFYSFPSGYSADYHVFEISSGKTWFIRSTGSGTSNCIASFDYSLYSGTTVIQKKGGIEMLDVNQVRAAVLNRGDMHWDLTQSAYEVPKNSGRKAIFTSSLWIGGLDNGGTLHQAAMTYRQTGNDYWPGPLDTLTGTTDSATSAMYDKIWKLDRWQIDEFRTMFANGSVSSGAYVPAYNIIHWPAHGAGAYTRSMAPFVDVNGDGNYNPMMDGDYPKIKGDQMCYWIFNDNLNVHTETGAPALKVEVHASAYAYNCDSLSDSLKALNYTTFYNYDIFNRSSFSYHDTYLSFWMDGDVGGYNDDYVGCNRFGNYSFQYNADSIDESLSGLLGYGENPPMISNVILKGPVAPSADGIDNDNDGTTDEAGERNLMTNVLNYNNNNNPVNGNPSFAGDFYNYMRSKWRDGSPTVYGGDGTGAGSLYNFMYDGVPGPVGWSEVSEGNSFVDRRIVMSCGPFNFAPAEQVNYTMAIVYSRDDNPVYTINNLYNRNQHDVSTIRQWYNNDNFPSCEPATAAGVNSLNNPSENELKLYPNPASSLLYIDYITDSRNATIEVYDMRGLLTTAMKADLSGKQSINTESLSKGLYVVKVNDKGKTVTKKFLKN